MKHVLILFVAVISFAACSEKNNTSYDFANEVVNSYTNEQVEELIAGFDAKTIDYGRLVADLISGSIYNTKALYSQDGEVWSKEVMYDGGDLSILTSANWLFEDGGACLRFVRTHGSIEPSPKENYLFEWQWRLDREQQMVVVSAPTENCPEYCYCLKIVYYNSPLMIFDQTAHQTIDADFDLIVSRHRVNLQALPHDKVEAIIKERMAENK